MDFSPIFNVLGAAVVSALPTIIGASAVLGMLYYFFKHPDSKYAPYKGLVIQAVKSAEKAIPDDTPNKSLMKADAALKTFNNLYEQNTGKTMDDATRAWFLRVKEEILLELQKVPK